MGLRGGRMQSRKCCRLQVSWHFCSMVGVMVGVGRGAMVGVGRASLLCAAALLATAARADLDISCQIFDETMVCDNEKERLHHAEVRTCSG